MKTTKAVLFGIFYGAIFSVVSGMLLTAGGGSTVFGDSWLYIAISLPFILTFTVLGAYFSKIHDISKKKVWLISAISAFFISLYTGTIGTLLGEYIVRGGMETIRVETTLVAGVLYTFALLPITVPILWLLIMGFGQMLTQFQWSNVKRFQDVERVDGYEQE